MGCLFSRLLTQVKTYGECVICLENLDSNSIITALKCGHIYHEGCVQKWLNKNSVCPICSTKI